MINKRKIAVKQRDLTDCGPACIASMARIYGKRQNLAQVRQNCGTDQKGTSAFGVIRGLEKMGFQARGVRYPDKQPEQLPSTSILHLIKEGGIHHYVVFLGKRGQRYRIMDPSPGKVIKLSPEQLQRSWSGVAILTAPKKELGDLKSCTSHWQRFRYLLTPHRKVFLASGLLAALYTLLGFSTSIYIQKLTDVILVFGLQKMLHLASFALLLILCFQTIFSVSRSTLILKAGQLIDARLILGYYRHLLQLPQSFFDSMRVGEIISRINDASRIRQFLSDTVISFVLNGLILMLSIGLLFIFHWKLALIAAMILPTFGAIYWITDRLNRDQERKLMIKGAELESQLVESIQQIKTIKQLGNHSQMIQRTEQRFIDLLGSGYRSGMNQLFSRTSSEVTARIITLLILWLGSGMIFNQELTLGQLMSFYTILGYMSGPAAGLIGMNRSIQHALIASDRLFELMDLEQERSSGKLQDFSLSGAPIQFQKVSFSYGTRTPLFDALDLSIRPGEITGIIGESGSGKSTIASLLCGLYSVQKGSILIGGRRLDHLHSTKLRRVVSVVPQQTVLFSGSLIDNICPLDEPHRESRTLKLCDAVGLTGFINRLPQGIHTEISEGGRHFSGGERQRLAIVRALYTDPDILILDEATSALDRAAERRVLQLLFRLKEAGKTILVITHRLGMTSHFDQLLILKEGKLIEQGSCRELLEKQGHFSQLYNSA